MIKEFDPPLQLVFVDRSHEYGDVYTCVFEKPEGFDFQAGQNVRIVIPHLEGTEGKRSLSIASTPSDGHLIFSMHVGSGSQFKKAMEALAPGETVDLVKLKGHTVLPEKTPKEVVLIAGGVGMTPFRSLILDALERKLGTDITLIHVCSAEYLYEKELASLPVTQKRIGRPDVEDTVCGIAKEKPDALFFAAGSPSFLDAIETLLKQNNIPESNMLISRFTGYEQLLD